MPVQNPKLLQDFQYKGYYIEQDSELDLDYINKQWSVDGMLVHQETGDRIEARIDTNGPDALVEELQQLVDEQTE